MSTSNCGRIAILVGGFIAMSGFYAQSAPIEAVKAQQVKLGGEFGRRIDITINNNLLALDADKDFLGPLQRKEANEGYVGIGKLIDSMARLTAYTGNERLATLKKHVVDAVLATQEADGYIGMMKPEARIRQLWDVHEMSYLVMGLTSDFAACGEKASLEGARRLGDYLMARLTADPRPQVGDGTLSATMPDTGLEEAFLNLAEQTGDARYATFARTYRPLKGWHAPLVLGRCGKIEGHAYAYIDKCLSQLRIFPEDKDVSLLEPSRDVARFLIEKEGLVISGTCGDHECWHDTQSGTTNLGETCTVVYLLRFWDQLMRMTGAATYGDLMERAIYNGLFAAQSPDGRRIRYYAPFEAPRVFYDTDTYCCPCNYRRAIADLPRYAYYRAGEAVAVNLYTPSSFDTAVKDDIALTVRQETDYPNSGAVNLSIDPAQPVRFPLWVRVPRWCTQADIRVNDKPADLGKSAGGFRIIVREWRAGDKVQLTFEMPWRLVKGRRAQVGRVAIMRGPQVFTLAPDKNEKMEGIDARLMVLDPASIEAPTPDDSVRPGGVACHAHMWNPGEWYPFSATRPVVLTEFADPGSVATYFVVPNPNDERLVDDELANVANMEYLLP